MSAAASHDETVLVTEPKQPDKSLGELFANLGRELGELVRKEMELAKTETRQELRTAGKAGASFAVAAVAALLALIFLSAALAFLIVGLIWAVCTAVAITMARARMRELEPMPQTMETLKEDVEWAKQQTA